MNWERKFGAQRALNLLYQLSHLGDLFIDSIHLIFHLSFKFYSMQISNNTTERKLPGQAV